MSKLGGERGSVQNPLIKYATSIGWTYVSPNDALGLRGGEGGLVFKQLLIDQLTKLNSFMTPAMAEEVVRQIERIPSTVEGNLTAWEYIKGLKTVFVPSEKQERNIRLIDANNLSTNVFQVTDEFSFTNGRKTVRADVVFLVNGVPILVSETKAAHKTDGIQWALDQIKRYHKEAPELLTLLQLYSLTHILRFYYSSTWNFSRKWLFDWKEEARGDFETLVKAFFLKDRFIKILSDFILFTRQDDELLKVVLRPHQMRAVDRIISRASSPKSRGLIWHTQGSGKTYTMIVAAQKIIENPVFENPTVIMLVDRNELESQLYGNLASVGLQEVKVAESKRDLRQALTNDTRGLIVTMIHKFEEMPAEINTRKNIFVLVDEAHRTTGGKLGNYLMGALPNATYIGFTGTPIDRTQYGKGTFLVFGKDDPPHGYLDRYSIAESIEDGTTVQLHYTLAPNELRVDKEVLEKEFLDLAETQGISDIESLNRVLERAVTLRNMLKNAERVQSIGKYIADHFSQFVEPMGYKAFVVGVDREACALYKKELDKHLPPEYSKVVYSPGMNDDEALAQYHLSEEEEKRIRKAFRKPDQSPKILIVTEKLLTGFDAPVLYCMYLDKPMRDHVLLQAIARVNRPYDDSEGRKKPSGFVLDFVGIFDNLEKALAFDSKDIEGIVHDIDLLKGRFEQLFALARQQYLSILQGKTHDKAVEAVLEHFKEEEKRHEFYDFFRKVADFYEILSPDAFLRPFLDDYDTLARMFRILREAYEPGAWIDRDFAKKTAKLVQEHTQTGAIKSTLDVYEINEETVRKLEQNKASDTEKVFNLLKSFEKITAEEAEKNPYLISISEKAERISLLYRERQKTTEETLNELKSLIEELNAARKEQAERKMPVEVFSVFWILKDEGVSQPEEKALAVKEVMERYPHFRNSAEHERKVKQELYKVLIKSGIEVDKTMQIAQRVAKALAGGEK